MDYELISEVNKESYSHYEPKGSAEALMSWLLNA
jgi:hypothetical protein